MILGEKIERKVYVNQQNFVSDIQVLIKHSFRLSFLRELSMSITKNIVFIDLKNPYSWQKQMIIREKSKGP